MSDLFTLKPPLNVQTGTVMLTLKFGAPCDVVQPGRKLRRGRGLPLTLAPEGIIVSTEDVPIQKYVSNVVVQGPYGVSGVEVDLRIAVDRSDDFAGLKNYVAQKGKNFADLLDAEVGNALDAAVRDALRDSTAQDLYERGNLTSRLAGLERLLDGLFVVRSIQRVRADWDPEFIRVREAAARKARELAEKALELEHTLTIDRELQSAKDLAAAETAQRRGLSLNELENPELVALQRQQDHEVRLAMIEQMESLRRVGGLELVGEVLRSNSVAGRWTPELASPEPSSWSMTSLERDKTLASFWKKSGLPGEPIGLSLSEFSAETTVVVVSTGELPSGDEAVAVYGHHVDASRVLTIDNVSTIEEIVEKYLASVQPALAEADLHIRVLAEGDVVRIQVGSEKIRLGPVLRDLTVPDSELLVPLRDLLRASAVVLEIAGG
ncbi:hypothetical protein [Nocardioides plantarum]|uniref:Band 7 domain-containing protein n=1 Tax=Nocardioides plantarum TaxID=29299 RepID=A0ABV5KEH3_9ACTN|nr:hypothetical protein [Nocardioides plantarum]